MNRNGSRTLCVLKVHYRDRAGSGRKLLQIQADLVFGPYGVEVVGIDLRFDGVERARVLLRGLGVRHRRLEQSNFSQISSRHGSRLFMAVVLASRCRNTAH